MRERRERKEEKRREKGETKRHRDIERDADAWYLFGMEKCSENSSHSAF